MGWNRHSPLVVAAAMALAFACYLPVSAEPKPTAVNATVVNGGANPVPVVIQGEVAPQLVSFREGYQVPTGKRLLIDDVSVACTTVGTTQENFTTFGLSASALLHVTYPPANCPEPLDSEGECHQLYAVGTAKQNGIEPLFLTAPPDSRPAARLWAGRQMSVFADQGATLIGQCDGILVNLIGFSLRGTGRLVNRP